MNRPQSHNALTAQMLDEIMQSMAVFDQDQEIGALVLTGGERAFAAGADITALISASTAEIKSSSFLPSFDLIQKISKPVLAAVSGYCLGGGNELALSCDMIIASETALFGQPEINLGIIPGAGGTQRLTRILGKALAMEMVLNNRTLSAEEARSLHLVNHVYPVETYLEEALSLAQSIAARAPLAVKAGKEMVNRAYETALSAGLEEERQAFYALFATEDQQEGMKAFLEKRTPVWKGR
jgi:enoyl-CoA hydratase